MLLIITYFICTSKQSGKFQVKDMIVYIEPLIDKLLKLWNGITMYDVSRPILKRQFQFHAMVVWMFGTHGTPKRPNTLSNRFTQIDDRSTHRCLSRG